MDLDGALAPPLPAGTSACVEIDLEAIRDNTAELKRRAGSAEVMAVVKADGYGHGALPAARAALAGGATWLGVAQLDEALALRAAGIDAPLLTWLYVPGADFARALRAGIDVTVSSTWALDAVLAAAESTGQNARVSSNAASDPCPPRQARYLPARLAAPPPPGRGSPRASRY